MTLDAENLRFILTGFFVFGAGVISWLLNRQINRMDKDLDDHDKRIDSNLQLINGIKQDFVSRTELKEQLNIQLTPLKENIREIRDDIRGMGEDIKSLLKRP